MITQETQKETEGCTDSAGESAKRWGAGVNLFSIKYTKGQAHAQIRVLIFYRSRCGAKFKTMKTLLYGFSLLTLCLFFSCTNDDDMSGPGGTDIRAEVLPCRIESDRVLTDRNPDGADYIVDCRELEIYGGTVTVEPGTTIQLTNGSSIDVGNDGRLSAVGTANEKIRFVGTDGGTAPTWGYIFFNNTNAGNRLEHVIVENGGTEELLFFERTTIALEGTLAMNNVTVRYSGGNGFTANTPLNPVNITEFRNNTFSDNAGVPISVTPEEVAALDLTTCTFANNGEDVIRVGRDLSANARLDTESTWLAGPIPYLIHNGIDITEGLTIEAGTEVIFESGASLEVVRYDGSAYLTVNGTEERPVIMRGEVSVPGAWPGILVETSNVRNVFNHLDISDGGEVFLSPFDVGRGNITLYFEEARLTLNDCTSTRTECEVVLDNQLGEVQLTNNSPAITDICSN